MFAREDLLVSDERPPQLPEGKLIADAMIRDGRSARQLAANVGISDTRWRHIVNGYQPVGRGQFIRIVAPADTLARMAAALGVGAEQLAAVGREDAAKDLRSIAAVEQSGSTSDGSDSAITKVMRRTDIPESEKQRIVQRLIKMRREDEQRREDVADDLLAAWDRARGT